MSKTKVTNKKEPLSISIRSDQKQWIENNVSWFNVSKWVQSVLDSFIYSMEKLRR